MPLGFGLPCRSSTDFIQHEMRQP